MRTELEQAMSLLERARLYANATDRSGELAEKLDYALSHVGAALLIVLKREMDVVRERCKEHAAEDDD